MQEIDDGIEFEEDGGALVDVEPQEEAPILAGEFGDNLVTTLPKETIKEIYDVVAQGYQADKDSRSKWEQIIKAGLELLGTDLSDKEDGDWQCDVIHPLIIENACKFQAKAIQELWPAAGPVKTQILGVETDEKVAKALRIKKYMNWQVEELMEEFYDDTEKILFNTALFGTSVRKFYYDSTLSRPVGEMIPINRFYVNYMAPDVRRANRTTEVIIYSKNEFNKLVDSEFYIEADGEPIEAKPIEISDIEKKTAETLGLEYVDQENEGHVILEQHVYLDIDIDPFKPKWGTAPYVVAIHEATQQVLSIRRNWRQGDPLFRKLNWYVCRNFVPGFFGPYGFGLIHLLGQITQTASFSLRALIEAGRFANHPAGIKDKHIKMANSSEPLAPGEWRDAEANSVELKDGLVPLPYKEPSPTLFSLVQFILDAGQKFADSQDQVISDSTTYGPVGTTMALLEASAKFYSSIHKRMHRAFKDEFKILARLNSENLPSRLTIPINGEMLMIGAHDFQGDVDIVPVSDPNTPSQAQRATIAQAIVGMAAQAPAIHDMRAVYTKFYQTLGIEDAQRLVPQPPQPQPQEPLQDILLVQQGAPIKAFPGQDHDAHIIVKQAFIAMPEQQQQSQLPFKSILEANIREHMALRYAELVMAAAEQTGMPLQEAQKQVANQVLQYSLADARMKANKALAEDPMFQLKLRDIEHQERKTKVDVLKSAVDYALDSRELDIKEAGLKLEAADVAAGRSIEVEVAKNSDARARESNAIKALQVEATREAKRDRAR